MAQKEIKNIFTKFKSISIKVALISLGFTLISCPPMAVIRDTDGDGIIDTEDDCPYASGSVEFGGCPDSDGDGIIDGEDLCPDIPGLLEFLGCADTDEDGIPDNWDQCPEVSGTVANNGCPEVEVGSTGDTKIKYFPIDPAPKASDVHPIDKKFFANAKSNEDFNQILIRALDANKYYRKTYYPAKGGFALVTQLEQINADGSSKNESNRWVTDIIIKMDEFSLSEYFKILFSATPGYYRCIVFIVSTENITFSDREISQDDIESFLSEGWIEKLPMEIGSNGNPNASVTALIYQFKKNTNTDEPVFVGNITPRISLQKSGIIKSLENGN